MAGFRDIIGHEEIIAHFRNAVRSDKVSHAYILNGPEGSGKRMLAEAFAALLNCEVPRDGEPCGQCRSCRQAAGHNQPDILYLTHEKAGISVDDVRRQIGATVDILPYGSPYKVYLVDEAEKMNVQAQNALLKTLEEPPSYVVILLLTTNAEMFLPTVLSRCVLLNLHAVDDARIRTHLMRTCRVPDYEADLCVAFAQGNVGRAKALASSEPFRQGRENVTSLVRRLSSIPNYEVGQELAPLLEHKEDIPLFLDLLLLFFRDVLLYKATGDAGRLIFKDQSPLIQQMAARSSFAALERIIESIETAARRIGANVNAALSLELFVMDMKENLE